MTGLSIFLEQVPDYRREQGKRVKLPVFLTMVVLGYMSGRYSIQSLARFMKNNEEYFSELFGLSHGVPGYTQTRTILQSIDFNALNKAFYNWASQFISQEDEDWLSIDGKAMKSTVTDYELSKQNFQAMASVFSRSKGIMLTGIKYKNKKASEIHTVQELIQDIEQKGMVLTLDALHCQKKPRSLSWTEEMTM